MWQSIGMKKIASMKCLKCVKCLQQSSILFAGTGIRKKSTVASESSPMKIHYFDYHKRFINRKNEL